MSATTNESGTERAAALLARMVEIDMLDAAEARCEADVEVPNGDVIEELTGDWCGALISFFHDLNGTEVL